MQYVVCYDIADNGRRERVASALLDYGKRIQESVFLANLDEDLVQRMMRRLSGLIEPIEDCVHIFTICAACEPRIRTLGRAELPVDRDHYIL